jgi:hypothetical protein
MTSVKLRTHPEPISGGGAFEAALVSAGAHPTGRSEAEDGAAVARRRGRRKLRLIAGDWLRMGGADGVDNVASKLCGLLVSEPGSLFIAARHLRGPKQYNIGPSIRLSGAAERQTRRGSHGEFGVPWRAPGYGALVEQADDFRSDVRERILR